MSWWRWKFNHLQFFVVLMFNNVVAAWFHEFGHAVTGILGHGVIKTIGMGFGVFWVEFAVDPIGFWGWIMPFAGGLFASVYAYIIVWAADLDPDVRIAFWAIGVPQTIYGLVEGILFYAGRYDLVLPIGTAAMVLGNVIAVGTAREMWAMEEKDNGN